MRGERPKGFFQVEGSTVLRRHRTADGFLWEVFLWHKCFWEFTIVFRWAATLDFFVLRLFSSMYSDKNCNPYLEIEKVVPVFFTLTKKMFLINLYALENLKIKLVQKIIHFYLIQNYLTH